MRDGTGQDVINDGATAGGGFGDEDFDPKSYCNYTFDYPHEEVWLNGYGGEGDDVAKKDKRKKNKAKLGPISAPRLIKNL